MDSGGFVSDSIAISLARGVAVLSAAGLNLSIALRFGVGHQADAFFLAYVAPGVLAGAMTTAMQVALVPSFVHLLEERPGGWRTISALGLVGLLLWTVVALVAILGGPLYIDLVAPSLPSAVQKLAVQISRWVFVLVPLTWLVEYLRALLTAQRRFVLPLVGECAANLLAVGMILVVGQRMGVMIVGFSFIAKMLLQATVSTLGLELDLQAMRPLVTMAYGKKMWSALRGFVIRLGGSLLREGSTMVERLWSASLEVGTLSALSYSQMGANVLSKVLSTSVATVLLPTLSHITGRLQEKHASATEDALRLVMFLTAPVAGLGIVLSYPICRVVFALSDTPAASVILTSRLLMIYALRTSTLAVISVLLTPFYARGDVWTPVKHMIIMLGVNLTLDISLFPVLAVYAFPVAAVLTDALSIGRAFWLQKRLGIGYSVRELGRDSGIILTSAGLAVAMVLAMRQWGTHIGQDDVAQLILLIFAAVSGTAVYLTVTFAAGIPEARLLARTIRKRFH